MSSGNDQGTPTCEPKCRSGYNVSYEDDLHRGETAYELDEYADDVIGNIQVEIMTYGPVEATFTVYADFLSYKSGVYRYSTGDEIGVQAVKLLGWGVEKDTPYWLAANSWNDDWGDKGFFKIIRGAFDANGGIEYNVFAGLAPNQN